MGAFLCVSFVYRFHVLFGGQPDLLLYINTLARADPLLIGALGAYLWATRARAPSSRVARMVGSRHRDLVGRPPRRHQDVAAHRLDRDGRRNDDADPCDRE